MRSEKITSSSEPTSQSSEWLQELYEECFLKEPDLENAIGPIDRTALRAAQVTNIEVVRGTVAQAPPYLYLTFDLVLGECENLSTMEKTLQFKHSPGQPDMTLRMQPTYFAHSRGGSYDVKAQFRCDPEWRRDASEKALLRIEFPKLRLYHVLDLVRMLKQKLRQLGQHEQLNHNSLPLLLADALHPYASEWRQTPLFASHDVVEEYVDALENVRLTVMTKFSKRWGTEPVANSGFQPIRSRPKDGGPLCYFPRHSASLQHQFSKVVQATPLPEFCRQVLEPPYPPDALAKIVELVRYQKKEKPYHQFVLLHAQLLDVEDLASIDFWMRIDRAADLHGQRRSLSNVSSSVFPASDTVRLAKKEETLLEAPGHYDELVRTQYSPLTSRATVREVVKALAIFCRESTNYVLLTENCYYLAALLQEIVAIHAGTEYASPSGSWAVRAPTRTRGRVLKLMNKNRSESSLVEQVVESNTDGIIGAMDNEFKGMQESVNGGQLPDSERGSRPSYASRGSSMFVRTWSRGSEFTIGSVDNQIPMVDEPETLPDGPHDEMVTASTAASGVTVPRRESRTKRTMSRAMSIISFKSRRGWARGATAELVEGPED